MRRCFDNFGSVGIFFQKIFIFGAPDVISFGNHIWGSKSFLFFLFDLIMNEENKMTKLAALGEQARPQPIRQGSQPAGKKRVTNVRAPKTCPLGHVFGARFVPPKGGGDFLLN